MVNGERRMANDERRMANIERQTANDERNLAKGKWRLEQHDSGMMLMNNRAQSLLCIFNII